MDLLKSLEYASDLLLKANYVVCLTGAGVSVESGIRPYRGPDGLWTEHGEPPMDGFRQFMDDPAGAWDKLVTRQMFPPGFIEALFSAKPNPGHHALAKMEEIGIIKCLITQNVDNLHRSAGSKNLAEIHGNAHLLRCIKCGSRFPIAEISFDELPPSCPKCKGLIKTDGVLFGEPIPEDVLNKCAEEISKCDCILTVGTSACVYPAAGFPQLVKRRGGLIVEIDLHETPLSPFADVKIRGKSGEVLPQLANYIEAKIKQ